MRITGPGRVNSTQKSKGSKSASGTGAKFSVPSEAEEVSTPTNVASGSPIASVDAIVALQGVDDSTTSNKNAIKKSLDLLDRLEEIRHGLLIGSIPVDRLKQLKTALEQMNVPADDPGLGQIVRDIEVRAAVELAKLGY
ncbi:MAG: flagellar assembly protein FliX [Sneathiella sp.]|nr:flagellar assembly protein FliX [Sneathiella sp.]